MKSRWTLLAFGCLLFVAGIGASAGADSIPGLDSLASVTLERTMEIVGVRRAELGFDKMYVEDDTFRLGVVETLLNDPLELPRWQAGLVDRLRESTRAPSDLARALGAASGVDAGIVASAVGSRFFDMPASGAPNESRPVFNASLDRFIARLHAADASLIRAFAGLSAEERRRIVVLAPGFWGDWEGDPKGDGHARKGRIHFELGLDADTTVVLREKEILDAAGRLDRGALLDATIAFAGAWVDLTAEALCAPEPEQSVTLEGVGGDLRLVRETPWGLLVIGGIGDNVYGPSALRRIAFLIDPGGDDTYRGRAASAVGGALRPFAGLWDEGGRDMYDAGATPYALGSGLLGVAVLVDRAGDDIYRGEDGSLGAGFFGAGLLFDRGGCDLFEGRNFTQGAGGFGIGALIADGREEPPPGPDPERDRAFESGQVRVPGTGAVPVRYDENDVYRCARYGQGFASTLGCGLLYDRCGSDTYRAGGLYLHRPLRPNDFQSLSQGFSIGFRPRAGGGVGVLIDDEGNDFYDAEIYAQGTSYWYSVGLLFDRAGNDRYNASQYAQGAGVHLAVGSLWDMGGDDHYVCHLGVTQGTAHDLSVGFLIDQSGDDYYVVSDGQGMSITNSTAIFIDGQGNDVYATPGVGQGTLTWARDFCGAGIFLDLEGKDAYPSNSGGANGAEWMHDIDAVGIDLDRDIVLPDEVVPEPVLTAADSARSVEDLFHDASLWEVGSARETVARGRKALLTKGIAAVDYVVREKLASDDGLEYRAIQAVGESLPDSFTARILPRLFDPREQVQKNVIALLGDLKRKEGRAPLLRMLATKSQERHWTRSIQALGRIGDPAAAPQLRPFLRDPLERRRIVACSAIAALKDTVSIPALVDLLDRDPIMTARSAAFAALRTFVAASVGPLDARLGSSPERPAILVNALGRIALSLKDSRDPASLAARSRARRGIMAAYDRAIDSQMAEVRSASVEALLKLGEEEMEAFVSARMLDESDPLVRRTYERFKGD